MGQDKALLPFGDRTLAGWMAEGVGQVCGRVRLVGSLLKYSGLGYPVIEDLFPGQGPLAGIHAALQHSEAPFNLVVGCDMPYLSRAFLERLLEIAQSAEADVIVPESETLEYEPLCAVYTRACLGPVEEALQAGRRKISQVFARLRVRPVRRQEWLAYDPRGVLFRNINTPEDYGQARAELLAGR
ncbi:MAG: molybdenum cofactor guanylyltransferase [Acidobacteria bacterium]|nr:molybdenum cofactor guanylyltransferase [Acidobacteriota bacterium]